MNLSSLLIDQRIETEIAKSDSFSMTVDRDDFCVLLMPPIPNISIRIIINDLYQLAKNVSSETFLSTFLQNAQTK